MIPLWVSRSDVFSEFSPDEQVSFFDLKRDSYLPNIDNYYYSVHLYEGSSGIERLISDLEALKADFDPKSTEKIDFRGFDFYPFGLKGYNFRLSKPECFDILIRSSLPNNKTSRIWVQIRARYLWLEGPRKCLVDSFIQLEEILDSYNIMVAEVNENRIDYCVHTNAIQSPEKFFDRSKLKKHCKTNARIYNLVGNPQNNWSLDYCSIGSRKSNSLFFRVYNKSREVVEQNYKGFFFDIWVQNGLISQYDKYCLEYAFKMKSFDVGLLLGQIQWYLEFGKNDDRKKCLADLFDKYYVRNTNSRRIRDAVQFDDDKYISYDDITYIRKSLHRVLPAVTTITNIEFETHRDFYRSFDNSLLCLQRRPSNLLSRVILIYGLRAKFFDYLTSYGNFVSFVRDKVVLERNKNGVYFQEIVDGTSVSLSDFDSNMYLTFWRRLRGSDWNTSYKPDITRSYERQIDIERMKRKIQGDISTLSAYINGLNDNEFESDLADAIITLNDNDMHALLFVDASTGEVPEIKNGDYDTIKGVKNRQLRSIVPPSVQSGDK